MKIFSEMNSPQDRPLWQEVPRSQFRKILTLTVLLFMVILLSRIQANIANSKTNPVKEKQYGSVVIDTALTDFSRFIAGKETLRDYALLKGTNYWKEHSLAMNQEWDSVQQFKSVPIRRWVLQKRITTPADTSTLFYPFGAADFLYSNLYFNNASRTILVGLEPVGRLFDLASVPEKELMKYLGMIDLALYHSNRLGFFMTNDMRREMKQKRLNGTVHLLLFYLARFGYPIVSVTVCSIDSSGREISYGPAMGDTTKRQGVKIEFCDSLLNRLRTLYYFSYDLSDKNLKQNPGLLSFVDRQGEHGTMLKAASYLMHYDGFMIIRSYILSSSKKILQDDSGIPLRFFKSKQWKIEIFGVYTRTIKTFFREFQPDLEALYDARADRDTLPFKIGYNVFHNEANLMYAVPAALQRTIER